MPDSRQQPMQLGRPIITKTIILSSYPLIPFHLASFTAPIRLIIWGLKGQKRPINRLCRGIEPGFGRRLVPRPAGRGCHCRCKPVRRMNLQIRADQIGTNCATKNHKFHPCSYCRNCVQLPSIRIGPPQITADGRLPLPR
jgi:hypothetical protein